MSHANTLFRRRQFPLNTSCGSGHIAALEWGPTTGQHDILFLHANGFNAMTYDSLLAPLGAQGLRVLAIDLRGHGLTTLRAQPNASISNWNIYRDDLIALLQLLATQEGLPRVLSGHSMGAATCLLATLQWPGNLGEPRSLVLFEPVIAIPVEGGGTSSLVTGALRRKNNFVDPDAALASYLGRGAFKTWPTSTIRDYLTDGLFQGDDQAWHLRCAPEWEAQNFRHPFHPADTAIADLTSAMTIMRACAGSTCHWNDWPPQADVRAVPNSTHFLPMEWPDLAREALLHQCKNAAM